MANRGPLADPLIAAAGTDVSHWFSLPPPSNNSSSKNKLKSAPGVGDKFGSNKAASPSREGGGGGSGGGGGGRPDECEEAGDPRTFVDPQTGLTVPYLPMGRWVGGGSVRARSGWQ